jgi:RNA polymerase primary sigma factor
MIAIARRRTKKSRTRNGQANQPFHSDELLAQLIGFRRSELPETPSDSSASFAKSDWSKVKIEFIDNPHFAEPDAENEILSDGIFYAAENDFNSVSIAKLKSLPCHLARLCETRLLKPDEEVELFRRMNFLRYKAAEFQKHLLKQEIEPSDGAVENLMALLKAADWHRDLIVKSNMRLVISIVKKFVNNNNSFDDLLSDGIMAVIRAAEKFDFDRGFKFSTYATQVVRRNAYRTVMAKHKDRAKSISSLNEMKIDFEDRDTTSGMSPDRWNLLRSKLGLLLDKLDRRERLIVRARFSLGSHRKVQTLQRIADGLGVSKERVRQLEKRALDRLRELAADQHLPEFVSE